LLHRLSCLRPDASSSLPGSKLAKRFEFRVSRSSRVPARLALCRERWSGSQTLQYIPLCFVWNVELAAAPTNGWPLRTAVCARAYSPWMRSDSMVSATPDSVEGWVVGLATKGGKRTTRANRPSSDSVGRKGGLLICTRPPRERIFKVCVRSLRTPARPCLGREGPAGRRSGMRGLTRCCRRDRP
jgi:hypothetical protein